MKLEVNSAKIVVEKLKTTCNGSFKIEFDLPVDIRYNLFSRLVTPVMLNAC